MDHIARRHNALDRERFMVMIHNHWTFGQLRKNMPQYEHEHARVFDNSYVVQWWDMPSKTILAHIHKDGFNLFTQMRNKLDHLRFVRRQEYSHSQTTLFLQGQEVKNISK